MDAAGHRTAKTQSRKPVSLVRNADHVFTACGEHEPVAARASRTVSAAEGYECWAPTYDHAPNPLLAREERHLLPFFKDLCGKSALDLACGTGRWLERLIAGGCESAIGIDCSLAMLHVASGKPAISKRLARADCENLPLPSASFDLVICSFAIGHIGDIAAVARELERVTKTGADIFVTDLHPDAYLSGWRVGFRSGGAAMQIEMHPRSADEIAQTFCNRAFTCEASTPLWLGEPERPIFSRAGRSHAFEEGCTLPAVLMFHFRRIHAHDQGDSRRPAGVRA